MDVKGTALAQQQVLAVFLPAGVFPCVIVIAAAEAIVLVATGPAKCWAVNLTRKLA